MRALQEQIEKMATEQTQEESKDIAHARELARIRIAHRNQVSGFAAVISYLTLLGYLHAAASL